MELKFVKLSSFAKTPVVEGNQYILFSAQDAVIRRNEAKTISTDIEIAVPRNVYIQVTKRLYTIGNVLLDYNSSGNIKLTIFNNTDEHIFIKRGDVIGVMTTYKIVVPTLSETDGIHGDFRPEIIIPSTSKAGFLN